MKEKDQKMNPEQCNKALAFARQKTKPELTKMCQERNISTKGTKYDLALRILDTKTKSKSLLRQERPVILIHKNKYGRYVHSSTGLVFDKLSKKVIGREDPNGQFHSLKRSDIQLCCQYKFHYILPQTLDAPSDGFVRKDEPMVMSDDDDDMEDDETEDWQDS